MHAFLQDLRAHLLLHEQRYRSLRCSWPSLANGEKKMNRKAASRRRSLIMTP